MTTTAIDDLARSETEAQPQTAIPQAEWPRWILVLCAIAVVSTASQLILVVAKGVPVGLADLTMVTAMAAVLGTCSATRMPGIIPSSRNLASVSVTICSTKIPFSLQPTTILPCSILTGGTSFSHRQVSSP